MAVLETTRQEGLVTLTLNRPDKLNALNDELSYALDEAISNLASDDQVRCVVVQGTGKAFCAGGDIQSMKERFGSVTASSQRQYMRTGPQRMIENLFELPCPTITKVDGPAVGAGMGLALACDIVVASEDATFGAPFRNLGLAIDAGLSYVLPRIVGLHKAKELAYTGELLSAEEAADLGLVNHVVESSEIDDFADDLADSVSNGPTEALALSKDLIHSGERLDFGAAIENENKAQSIAITTEDHQNGVEAFFDGGDPEFVGK